MTLRGNALVRALGRRFVTVNDDVLVDGRTINILRPRSAEDLISESDFDRDERLPYWAELWPASVVLADFILRQQLPPTRTVELGCGAGLVATAAMLAGHDVLATDYYDDALLFTRANAFRNTGSEVATSILDWRAIPDALPRFDLVLASDVLYESRYAELVARTFDRMLSPAGTGYLADPGRVAAGAFVDACTDVGLTIHQKETRPFLAGEIRQFIAVYEIRH